MNHSSLTRRQALARTGMVASALLGLPAINAHAQGGPQKSQAKQAFRFCLNTATIRGQKIGIEKEIETVAKAGYDGIEPWIDSLEEYTKGGGKLVDLKNRLNDAGVRVESAIGFPEWIVDDDSRRAKGLERAKREMDLVAQVGGKRFAAPPAGATDLPKLDPLKAAERYRALLEAGEQLGVVPQLELWGFSQNMNRLGECVGVAMETGHPNACVLADVFHLYKGGSEYRGMRLLGPGTIQVLHMNDYPSNPPRDKIDDGFRILPGDGIAPLTEILTVLHQTGGEKVLSLELFNRKYWSEEPLAVAKLGLAKMKTCVEKVQI